MKRNVRLELFFPLPTFFYSGSFFALVVLIVATGLSVPAFAQVNGQLNEQLVQRLESLEKKLLRLQRQVNTGAPASTDATSTNVNKSARRGVPATAVEAEARLSEAEDSLRRMNGKVEGLNIGLANIKKEIKKLNKDVDLRLREIEKKLQTTASQTNNDSSAVGGGAAKSSKTQSVRANSAQSNNQADITSNTGIKLPKGDAKTQYAFAIDLMDKGDYGKAEQAFVAFIKVNGADPLAGNAQYWLGETYYVREDYDRAARAFLHGFKKYPGSSKAPDNLLKLGKTMRKLKQKDKACAVLSELQSRYPAASNTIRRLVRRERRAAGC